MRASFICRDIKVLFEDGDLFSCMKCRSLHEVH
jgi:hypothetical protein